MLYDKRWEKSEVPVKLEPWQETLLAAADLIERCGLAKKAFERDGGFCTAGAIIRAAHPKDLIANHIGDPLVAKCLAAVGDQIGMRLIGLWNDKPSRTKAEVVAVLRAAAR